MPSLASVRRAEACWKGSPHVDRAALDFDHALTGHALAGTKKDAAESLRYLEDISRGIAAGVGAGRSLAEIQKTLMLEAYRGFERWDTTREAHIAAVYATIKGTRPGTPPGTR